MDSIDFEEFEVHINPETPLFVISVVSELVKIPVWTLRRLDQMDIVKPRRIGKKTRCYSQNQIQTLNYIYFLMEKKGINMSGIKFFIEMREKE